MKLTIEKEWVTKAGLVAKAEVQENGITLIEDFYDKEKTKPSRRGYLDIDGKRTGEWIQWYTTGGIHSKEIFYKKEGHFLISEWICFYPNGSIREQGGYKRGKFGNDDKEIGEWIHYYENGQIESKGSYSDDCEATGEWIGFYSNGQTFYKGSYENGTKTGEWCRWHINGRLESKGIYQGGEKTGEWTEWHGNGTLRTVSQWDNGTKMETSK